jgi:enoyl-CoA hydratase/carnithine racemase
MSVITVEERGPVSIIRINRPEKLNAINKAVAIELQQAFAEFDRSDQRVAILTGAGDQAFCSGMDLGSTEAAVSAGPIAAHEGRRAYAGLLAALPRLGKPVVAAVNAVALGGGMGLLAACDLAIAADDAQFGTPEVDVGLFPYMALAPLSRCVGRRTALELFFTARRIDAQEARAIGLINRAVPRAALAGAAQELLDVLAAKSPTALRLGRRAFYATQDLPYEAQLEALCAHLSVNAVSADTAEGVAAFREKRKPDFKGG